jgi:4-amino-4-deoxy-L-arabinose transferase-like glycosyltransferase
MGLFQVFWLVMRWILMRDPDWRQLPAMIAIAVGAAAVAVAVPSELILKLRDVGGILLRHERALVLVLMALVLATGGVYASFRRFHADEPGSFKAATVVATEGVARFFQTYSTISWLGRQHPPLTPLIYGAAMRALGVKLWVTRSITLLFTAATVALTFALGAAWYDRHAGVTAALLMLSFPYTLHIGSLSTNDLPVTFLFTLAALLLVRLLREPGYRLAVATSVVIGAGLLTKYTMVMAYGAAALFAVVLRAPLRRLLPYLTVALLISAAILSVWLVYAHQTGVLSRQVVTVADYLGYQSDWSGGPLAAESWKMGQRIEVMCGRLPSAVGAFGVPILVMAGWHVARRRRQSDLLSLAWVVAVSLPVAALLPDARYFLPAFPALALVMTSGLRSVPGGAERPTFLALCYGAQALYLYLVLDQAARIVPG